MRTIETKVYTINEHPMKSLCFDWMRENLPDLTQDTTGEVMESIDKLTEAIGGSNDYLFRPIPRSNHFMLMNAPNELFRQPEFVKFINYDTKALMEIDAEAMPLTGCWTDFRVIKSLQESPSFEDEEGNLICYPVDILDDLHQDAEYKYSDEGLEEYADMCEFEFTTKGELI